MSLARRFFILLAALFYSLVAIPQTLERHQLKAALIFNFAKQITWPEEQQNDSAAKHISFAIYGEDEALYNTLRSGINGKSLRGMTIHVTKVDDPKDLSAPALLIVSRSSASAIPRLLEAASNQHLLLVTDNAKDKSLVMINVIDEASGRISFEINRPNILQNNLIIGPDILLLGGTDLDVVALFEQAEQKLAASQSKAARLENQLIDANTKLDKINRQIDKRAVDLTRKSNELVQAEIAIDQKSRDISVRESAIETLDRQLETLKNSAREASDQAKKSSDDAIKSRQELADFKSQQSKALAEFNKLKQEIARKQAELEEISEKLNAETETNRIQQTIINQQNIQLVAIGIVLFGVGGLMLSLARSRRHLVRSREQLETNNQALKEARALAEKASAAKSQFLATMSHEIRTPMNAIIGMSEILRERSLDQQERESIDIIYNAGIGLLTVLNDILDFSKIEAGKMEICPTVFKPEDLIRETMSIFAQAANEKHLALTVSIAKNLPKSAIGDAQRIRQMLINLLSNALKFTDSGSITLTSHYENERLILEVRDTGAGMSENDCDQLFTEFTQVGTLHGRQGGTGLGLAICRRLTQLMGGEIQVTSELGKGTRFTLILPIAPQTGDATKQLETATVKSVQPNLLIWIAEDNKVNQRVIETLLKKFGHTSRLYNDGQAIVDAVARDTPLPDLIFMDCEMPKLDGWAATRAIRALEKQQQRKPLYIVALTAHALDEFTQKSMASGMDAVLHKPITYESLAKGLESVHSAIKNNA